MPALWNRRYFVKCVSEVKRAVQEMTLGSKTDETWLETNILSPQVEEKFNVGGSKFSYRVIQINYFRIKNNHEMFL